MGYQRIYTPADIDFGRVAVLYGGLSAERSISMQSGEAILSALNSGNINAFGIDIGENPCKQIIDAEFDRAFIAMHGGDGEDGKIQALLDLIGKPYTGSNHAASALAMNKLHSKQVWQSWSLPTPPYIALTEKVALQTVLDTLGHVFVKPVHQGSSYGISAAHSLRELEKAASNARVYDSNVIAEKLIVGKEYSVAVLGGTALEPIEIVVESDFYDFEAKYVSDRTRCECPTNLNASEKAILKDLALKAFKTLGCSGWGRIDFMCNENDEFFLLEANTVPGMTSHSLVPVAASYEGLSFSDLVLEILAYSCVTTL